MSLPSIDVSLNKNTDFSNQINRKKSFYNPYSTMKSVSEISMNDIPITSQRVKLLANFFESCSDNPEFISDLIKGVESGIYEKYEGCNRDVFINKKSGKGFKVYKNIVKPNEIYNVKSDLRLNNIYKSKLFYNGIYNKYAKNDAMLMINDLEKIRTLTHVSIFYTIPNAERLKEDEKIPWSCLAMMEQSNFRPFDIKPDNFIKIPVSNDEHHFLPIDSKLIGLNRSTSPRSRFLNELREKHGPYDYNCKYIDWYK